MVIADLPPDEDLRLLDLASYEIIDSPEENDFDELVELAAQICKSPISLITLVDKDQQWFKAKAGLEVKSTSRDVAFCSHAILQDEVMVVPDATRDERFFDNPLVTDDIKIRFYAGAPIVSPTGHKVGTLCVIDDQPHQQLLPEQEKALKILSNQVTKLLELRRKNLCIRKRAAEMIALKSKTISKVIQAEELRKKEISFSLHEDLAQSVASGMMFMQLAADSSVKDSPHWKTGYEQLSAALTGIRKLSYDITPAAINFFPAAELVKEFTERVASTFPFDITTTIEGESNSSTNDKALVSIRIIEQWLKVLAGKKDVSKVMITLQAGTPFEMVIEDDGPLLSFSEMSQEVFNSTLFDIAQSHNGVVEHNVSATGKNALSISFHVHEHVMA